MDLTLTHRTRGELEEMLSNFVDLYKDGPKQRSQEWLAARMNTIGGSEIAGTMNVGPYSNFRSVLKGKVGLDTFRGNVACWWGTVFEDITQQVVEIDCNTTIVGTDISVRSPIFPYMAHSPDGYAVLPIRPTDTNEWEIGEYVDSRWCIALIEMKAPYRRVPKDVVPNQYQPQLWSGMALAPICDFAMFIDAQYKICSLDDVYGNGYNQDYHRDNIQIAPFASGVMIVYNKNEPSCMDPIDFGDNGDAFENALKRITCGEWSVLRPLPTFADGRGGNMADVFSMEVEGLIGYIPWKLFALTYVFEQKNPQFMNLAKGECERLITTAKEIRSADNIREEWDSRFAPKRRIAPNPLLWGVL